MADHRESQVLGYILAALVVAISGIAVGLASATPPAAHSGGHSSAIGEPVQNPSGR